MTKAVFKGDLSSPDPIPDDGISAATALMNDGRLFRYGEDRNSLPEAAMLEEEFADYMGMKYCLGVNSGGCAMFIALKAAGVQPGDKVLVNAFTLAPVPGAIAHAGCEAVLVDITERTVIDIDDLDKKAAASGAKYLLLSYMRGHIPDMADVMEICKKHDLIVIEDCAHTMGAGWADENGKMQLTGSFGDIGCFSTQTFKHLNSGEGGLLVTNNEDYAAKAVLFSGSYMLYAQHRARPDMEVFERHRYTTPNCSMRMSSLVASVLRPQLKLLDERNEDWKLSYSRIADVITDTAHIRMPARPNQEHFVPSSLQFMLEDMTETQIDTFLQQADENGVHIKWFGKKDPIGFTSRHDHWRYIAEAGKTPTADQLLQELCDIRLPLGLSAEDCKTIGLVINQAMDAAVG